MMVRHHKTKMNIPMCLAAVLLCLTLITMHMTSGLYAKYSTSTSGSDSARVIRFGELTLTEEGDFHDGNKLMIIPGVDLTKKATVTFSGSEAATYVFVEITPSKWTTDDNNKTFSLLVSGKTAMQWSVAEGWTFLKSVNGTYIYYRALIPGEKLNADIIAENGKITVSNQITKSEIESMTGISIILRATVVQSGGFKNPGSAWDSVAAKE